MRIIVLAQRKGGAGKTTLATHLAVAAEAAGAGPAWLIDTDEMQGAAKWWDAREAATPGLAHPRPDLATAVATLRIGGAGMVIIDTPPAAHAGVAAAIALADLVLIPVQPSPHDLRAVGATVAMAEAAGRPFVFVLNRIKPRTRLPLQAVVALSQSGPVASVQLADRIAYAAAQTDGLTAQEIEPDGLAAAEIAALWQYVAERMERAKP